MNDKVLTRSVKLSKANVKPTKSKPRLLILVVGVVVSSASAASMFAYAGKKTKEFVIQLGHGICGACNVQLLVVDIAVLETAGWHI